MSHHIVDEFLPPRRFHAPQHGQLAEQERDLMSVDLLHRPAVGALQALVVAQEILVGRKVQPFDMLPLDRTMKKSKSY